MSRFVAVRSFGVLLILAGAAAAQEPPPLEPPALDPPRADAPHPDRPVTASKPADPKPVAPARPGASPPTLARPEGRPMLAIPGVTAPASRRTANDRPLLSGPRPPGQSPIPPTLDALPLPLDIPAYRSTSGSRSSGFPLSEGSAPPPLDALPPRSGLSASRGPSRGVGSARPRATPAVPAGETIPLTIEPLDEERSKGANVPGGAGPSRTSNARASGAANPSRTPLDDEPIDPRPAPRRGPGVLGRLFGLQPPPPPRERPRTDEPKAKRDSDPESGPDPDVVARRRIERQIRATLGDKVRSFEVQITGRNVVVSAQPSRFWLRRSVRRSLETLPALQGYRTRIEISD
jgi:hypothetical protein